MVRLRLGNGVLLTGKSMRKMLYQSSPHLKSFMSSTENGPRDLARTPIFPVRGLPTVDRVPSHDE